MNFDVNSEATPKAASDWRIRERSTAGNLLDNNSR